LSKAVSTSGNEESAKSARRSEYEAWWQTFPWWMVAIAGLLIFMGLKIATDPDYDNAWDRISPGVGLTIRATLFGFAISLVIGLLAGFGQVSRNVIARNSARTYVEFIRGIPILPLIFTIALVVVPQATKAIGLANTISFEWRATIALAMIYGAYTAEVFRGGIVSIPPGQVEAGRSLGLTRRQTMRSIVLPQAFRAILPPLGNNFIAVLKDTSLLSVLGVAELTRLSRQYAAASFQLPETYFTLTFIYLCLVIGLSLLLALLERRLSKDIGDPSPFMTTVRANLTRAPKMEDSA